MTLYKGYIFDFQRTPRFFKGWNDKFKIANMEVDLNNFQIVFCDVAPTNIYDCLDSNHGLDTTKVNVMAVVDCCLQYNDEVISVKNDAVWNIGTDIESLKAIFIRDKETGFVMGYSINNTPFEVTNEVILEKDTILWSIQDWSVADG